MYTFNSQLSLGPVLTDSFTTEQIKNEPMLFSCDWEFALANGGPLTQSFLRHLRFEDWHDCIFDSRVHMLMPGWFPAIPGYHHDDVPRSKKNGQPNYTDPEYYSDHALCLVNADICPTEFALGIEQFPEPKDDEKCYKIWHPMVEKYLEEGKLKKFVAPDKQIVFFDWETWHQGTKAQKNGWRWFIRASRRTDRPIVNEIRRQVQVYLENPMEGW